MFFFVVLLCCSVLRCPKLEAKYYSKHVAELWISVVCQKEREMSKKWELFAGGVSLLKILYRETLYKKAPTSFLTSEF